MSSISPAYFDREAFMLTLLPSIIQAGDTLTVQANTEVEITNYLDLQGDLEVQGIFGIQ